MMKKTATLLGLALSAGVAITAQAEQGLWTINPMIGQQSFDDDRGLDDDMTLMLGLEYRFGDNWATEARYLDTGAEAEASGADVDISQYYVDGIYYFQPATEQLQPYAVAGLGYAEYDVGAWDSEEVQANIGAGVRYAFNEAWSLRADARAIHGFDDQTWDSLVSIGLSFSFGGTSAPAKAASPAPAPVAVKAVDGDDDKDGVLNSVDQCPNTAAGVAVNTKGCDLDSDGDGVVDAADQCPETPAGREVDAKGCKKLLVRDVEVSLNVNFASNSLVPREGSQAEIVKVVEFLKAYPELPVEIGGHTDNTGSAAYNQRLSQKRADAVADLLVNKYGIDASRVSAKGYGEDSPIATNDTEEGRLANRRVVATLKAQVKE